MLAEILLKRFKSLTLTEYESIKTGRTIIHAISNYGITHVNFYRYFESNNYKFKFPKNFSIKIIDFNDNKEIELLEDVKYIYDQEADKLTDIEIQNIFNYFAYLEKDYNDKCKAYCEQHNIPSDWIEHIHIPNVKDGEIKW